MTKKQFIKRLLTMMEDNAVVDWDYCDPAVEFEAIAEIIREFLNKKQRR